MQDLLSRSEQPYRSLLGTLQEREGRLREVGGAVSRLEGEIQRLQADRARLMETKNQMAADLERLLSHREVRGVMEQCNVCTFEWEASIRTHNSSLEGAMRLKFAPFCSP